MSRFTVSPRAVGVEEEFEELTLSSIRASLEGRGAIPHLRV